MASGAHHGAGNPDYAGHELSAFPYMLGDDLQQVSVATWIIALACG